MIFNTYSKKNAKNYLKNRKTLSFWQLYFVTEQPKEKFDTLCSDSIKNSELEDCLTSDILNFMQNSTHGIRETYFKTLDIKIL